MTQPYPSEQPAAPFNTAPVAPARPSMGFMQACKAFFQNYTTFSGRAGRSEFWYAILGLFIVNFIFQILSAVTNDSSFITVLSSLWTLATIIPALAMQSRRLHDTNHSGWFLLLHLIIGLGSLIVLILCIPASNPAGVRFDAKDGSQPALGE